MTRGDFAACEGVEPDDFSFDPSTGTLEVLPSDALENKRARFLRKVNVYDSNGIGKLAKSVTGGIGEPVRASYKMTSNDLYVRARIKSPERPVARAHLHPKFHVAWTQPYLNIR